MADWCVCPIFYTYLSAWGNMQSFFPLCLSLMLDPGFCIWRAFTQQLQVLMQSKQLSTRRLSVFLRSQVPSNLRVSIQPHHVSYCLNLHLHPRVLACNRVLSVPKFGETASWKGSSVWAEVVKLDVRCTFSQVAVAWKALGVKPSSTGVNTPSCSIIGPTALSLWCPSPRTLFVLCLPSTQIRERINLPFWLFSICSAFLWIIGSPGRDPWRALCSILGLVAVKPEAAAHSWLSESLKMS